MSELIMREEKRLIPTEHEMVVFHTMAETAVSSKMYKGIGEKAGVMMIMLSAREMNIPPMQALNGGLNIINGKVEISARIMSGLIRRAKHRIVVTECTDTLCVLQGKRGDTGDTLTTSFSLAEAHKAGLVKAGGGWIKFPKDMCFARALSRLARQLFSDVVGMGYVEGEINQTAEIDNNDIQQVILEHDINPVQGEEENVYVSKFVLQFDPQDQQMAIEWMNVIKKHFSWTVIQTIKEVMKDEIKMHEKFQFWLKNKKKGD